MPRDRLRLDPKGLVGDFPGIILPQAVFEIDHLHLPNHLVDRQIRGRIDPRFDLSHVVLPSTIMDVRHGRGRVPSRGLGLLSVPVKRVLLKSGAGSSGPRQKTGAPGTNRMCPAGFRDRGLQPDADFPPLQPLW